MIQTLLERDLLSWKDVSDMVRTNDTDSTNTATIGFMLGYHKLGLRLCYPTHSPHH